MKIYFKVSKFLLSKSFSKCPKFLNCQNLFQISKLFRRSKCFQVAQKFFYKKKILYKKFSHLLILFRVYLDYVFCVWWCFLFGFLNTQLNNFLEDSGGPDKDRLKIVVIQRTFYRSGPEKDFLKVVSVSLLLLFGL